MGQYSIKELENLSGIKAHTLRIWEKRHNIMAPGRTDTNIRFYSDEDLKKILNISILNNLGLKISKIANLSLDQLTDKVKELSSRQDESSLHIDQLIIAMVDLDEVKFEKLLNHLIMRFGFEKTVTHILYPFLEKIGILWLSNNINPAQEHFISNLIRQKLIAAIDALPLVSGPGVKKVMLFLPENELHEIGLLFYSYLLKKMEYKTIYLGQAVPIHDLMEVYKIHQPEYLVTSITSTLPTDLLKSYLLQLANKASASTIYVSGGQLAQVVQFLPTHMIPFRTAIELKNLFSATTKP
jgi:MerR family transcriptional regulator, light-induced transcriptional regulator